MSEKQKISDELKQELQQIIAAQRDTRHFAPLYDRYYKPIFVFIYRRVNAQELTADITSTVFLKALMNLKKYKFQGHPFSAWLFRIAVNEVNMHYRNAKKAFSVPLRETDVVEMMDEMELGSMSGDNDDRMQAVIEVMNELPPEHTQLIEMRFFEKRSFKEIGGIVGVTEANAKVKVYRILKKMNKLVTLKQQP